MGSDPHSCSEHVGSSTFSESVHLSQKPLEPMKTQSRSYINSPAVYSNPFHSFDESAGSITAGRTATSSQNPCLLDQRLVLEEAEDSETDSLLDYYLELDSSSSFSWSTPRSLNSDISDQNDREKQLQVQQPASKPTMERSRFSAVSNLSLRRHSTQKTVVGKNHPVLRALEEEARQLRCGQPCAARHCKCLGLETICDPEFCSDLTVCLSAVCCPFSGFH